MSHHKKKLFDYKNCKAYHKINYDYFFDTIRVEDLKNIANKLIERSNYKLKISRDIKRSKELLYKWFDDNWDSIEPDLHHIHLINSNYEEINKIHRQISTK